MLKMFSSAISGVAAVGAALLWALGFLQAAFSYQTSGSVAYLAASAGGFSLLIYQVL